VASVIASHYDQRWVGVSAYGIAALVGYARMTDDAHYLSDVVAGAVIGTTIGKLVVRTNQRAREVDDRAGARRRGGIGSLLTSGGRRGMPELLEEGTDIGLVVQAFVLGEELDSRATKE